MGFSNKTNCSALSVEISSAEGGLSSCGGGRTRAAMGTMTIGCTVLLLINKTHRIERRQDVKMNSVVSYHREQRSNASNLTLPSPSIVVLLAVTGS